MAAGPVPTFANVGWNAPAPFPDLIGPSRKVQLVGRDQARMDQTLKTLRLSGRAYGLTELKFLGEQSLFEALNAYNMRRLAREHRAWAWTDSRMLKVPPTSVNIINNAKWNPSDITGNEDHCLYEDFYNQWSPLATWPLRTIPGTPGCLKYRLGIFIHKHTPRRATGTVKKIDTVYSVSIWDRERNEICWHDPWPLGAQGKTERRQSIQKFWRDCPSNWKNNGLSNVNFANILQIQNTYLGLKTLQGCSFRKMEPRFTYWSVVGIILWCMNNIDNADPAFLMRPPDTPEVLSAMDRRLLPSLYVCLFQTMYENNFRFFWPPPGPAAPTPAEQVLIDGFTNLLENQYRLDFNEHFANEVNTMLAPFRSTNGGPIPDWAITGITGL